MFKEIEFTVVSLKRIRIGKLELGDLKIGASRKVTKKDIKLIFS